MKMLLPREIITWLDSNRGEYSRQAYIIELIQAIMNSNNSITYGEHHGNRNTGSQGRN